MRRVSLVLLAAAAILPVPLVAAQAEETPVTCGQVVVGTVKLANDLHCVETDGLIVGSDDTIIDLNGHRIVCTGAGYRGSCQGTAVASAPDEDPENGVSIEGHHNVHVFSSVYGATIDGFDNGVAIDRSSDVKVEHLIITAPPALEPADPANPRPFSHGIIIRQSNCAGDTQHHLGTGEKSGNDISNHNQGIAVNGSCVSIV